MCERCATAELARNSLGVPSLRDRDTAEWWEGGGRYGVYGRRGEWAGDFDTLTEAVVAADAQIGHPLLPCATVRARGRENHTVYLAYENGLGHRACAGGCPWDRCRCGMLEYLRRELSAPGSCLGVPWASLRAEGFGA
jgi:hypothetical protein